MRGAHVVCAWLVVLVALLAAGPRAMAAEAVPTEQDPETNARAVALSQQLRCLVCQNQTIADSNAELAVDLRRQVREQIAAGRTDREILDYMTQRYSDFVLYRPPFKPTTFLLWAGPILLLVAATLVLVRLVRSRPSGAQPALTDKEHARASRLLDGDPP